MGMNDRKRWLPFLIVNIFVSAAVTGAILFWYDQTYRQAVIPPSPTSVSVPDEVLPADVPVEDTLAPTDEISVEIVSVIGAETLDAEMVLIRYTGENELDLIGWQLKDEDRKVFPFPQLTLYPEGAVQVHTTSGQNTVVDLYWGLRNPVWESGEIATLVDAQGNERATYIVP